MDNTTRHTWLSAKTPVTMLALLALVVIAGIWGYRGTLAPVPSRPPEPCVVQEIGPVLTPERTTVQVHNGTTTNGLAKRVRLLLSGEGFRVVKSVNADSPAEQTHIVGFSADNPEVVLVRSYFDPATPFVVDESKIDHTVDIVIGPDFPGNLADGLPSVPLPDGTACLPTPGPTTTG